MEGLGEVGLEAVEVSAEDAGPREVTDEFTFLFGADESGGFELFHVMRERCGTDIDAFAHIAAKCCAVMAAELAEDLVTARVGEGLCDELDLRVGELDRLLRGGHGD